MYVIKKQPLIFFFSLLLLSSWGNLNVYAWHTLTHPYLSELALNSLPEEIRSKLTPYIEDIQWGAMAPDVTIKDWPNHDFSIHGDSRHTSDISLNLDSNVKESADASKRVTFLYNSIIEKLRSDSVNYSQIAYELGLMSHYIADICQPLHTDETPEESNFHVQYETDVYNFQGDFIFEESGFRLIGDIKGYISESANRANRHYTGVSNGYKEGDGYSSAKGITWICMQRSVQAIANLWISAWYQSSLSKNYVALHSNKRLFSHGDTMKVTLSTLLRSSDLPASLSDSANQPETGLYVAIVDPAATVWFAASDGSLSQSMKPWREIINSGGETENVNSESISESILFEELIWPQATEGDYHLYAAILSHDTSSSPSSYELMSNVSEITVTISKSPSFNLADLADETYIFPAIDQETKAIIPLALQQWDFILLGAREDIPFSPGDESQHDNLIPGSYNHLMIYLGRDKKGTPYAMEMTTFFDPEGYDLRPVRLPEYELFDQNSEAISVPVVSKSLWSHAARWARRLTPENLAKVKDKKNGLLAYLERDWLERIHYQMEYGWSGDLTDRTVHLVDDGLDGGGGCTDYWLSLFETHAGVCIVNARISAEEIVSYFKNDPMGKAAQIPDNLNPFPFSLYVTDLFSMGFKLVDPAPHIFSCEMPSETGIAIPSRILQSPQMEEISPFPAVYDWP